MVSGHGIQLQAAAGTYSRSFFARIQSLTHSGCIKERARAERIVSAA